MKLICMLVFSVATMVLANRQAAGGLIFVEQTRGISASAHAQYYNNPPVDVAKGISAEDFLAFDQTISAFAGSTGVAGSSSAWQRSEWSDWQILAQGNVSATAEGNTPPMHPGSSSSSGGSSFRVVFVLESPETVELSGALSATFQVPATFSGSVSLTNAEGAIVSHSLPMHFQSGQTLPFEDVLELQAGQYTLAAACLGSAFAETYPPMGANSSPAFTVDLHIVPEPSMLALSTGALYPLAALRRVRRLRGKQAIRPM
jgi:hypothetical protein